MKPEVKEKWLAALRSGEYPQSVGALRSDAGYCCLGVLCDLYRLENPSRWVEDHDDLGTAAFEWDPKRQAKRDGLEVTDAQNAAIDVPPMVVMRWAGLSEQNPCVGLEDDEGEERVADLASLNDFGLTFEQLADVIEEHL